MFSLGTIGGFSGLAGSAYNVPHIAHFPQKSMIYARSGRSGGRFRNITGIRVKWKPVLLQSPVPGLAEKYFSNFPSMPSKSLASGGDSFFWGMVGQLLAYSVFTSSHFSRPGSVSGLMASAGHSGSHTPQSMHSSGWMTSMFSPS